MPLAINSARYMAQLAVTHGTYKFLSDSTLDLREDFPRIRIAMRQSARAGEAHIKHS